MATYWYNSMLYKFLITNYAWHNGFDRPQEQLKNGTKKTNVEPDMATYWFNSVIYKYFITN